MTGTYAFGNIGSLNLDIHLIFSAAEPWDHGEDAASVLVSVVYIVRIARWELLYVTAVLTRG